MHDHDPRMSQLMIRTSPPRVCDFTPSSQINLKQQHQQNCQQQQQQPHHQMQHQQYHHQQFPQNPHTNLHAQHQLKKCGQFPLTDASFPPNSSSSAVNCDAFNIDEFEDVDEDEISDLEEEEEELRLTYERYRQNFHKQPDVTSQLLEFADMVSADIRKFFGRSKDQGDSCDVYEDKWVTAKSGRELYYADLLKIAQGDTEPASKTTKKSSASLSSPSSSSLSHDHEFDNRSRYSGRRNDSVGMGPLSELFEFGFSSYLHSDPEHMKTPSVSRSKVNRTQTMSRSHTLTGRVVPMFQRKLPESFWREPCVQVNGLTSTCLVRLETSQHTMLSSSKLPDFSDLVESWQGGIEGMATSEVNTGGSAPGEHHRL